MSEVGKNVKCEMMVEYFDFTTRYRKCGHPAKYITPYDKLHKKKLYVCGIHKNSVDKFYSRINSKLRCKLIDKEIEELENEY